jgi:asparaginyl-tRNA synthetase
MEPQTLRIKDIGPEHVGQTVRIRGWLRNKPGGKGRYFLWLRDGSGEVQAVAEQTEVEALPDGARIWADVERIGIESSIVVDGEVKPHPKNEGEFELALRGIEVVHAVADYPIAKKEHGVDFLMKNRHLWLRGRRQSAILRIRSEVHKAWSDFMYERGFYRVDTPIFTPNACEGTTTLFEVDYHGDVVYLTQSGQLYNEADIGALGQVYTFGPTFRAEKSKTRRHLLEFWMLEMEAAYYDFDANIKFQEEFLAYTVKRLLDRSLKDLRELGRDPAKLEPATQTPYPRLRYGDAIAIINEFRWAEMLRLRDQFKGASVSSELADSGVVPVHQLPVEQLRTIWHEGKADTIIFVAADDHDSDELPDPKKIQPYILTPFRWGDDFGAPDEAAIGARYDRPVFVTNFPTEIKGFYFKEEEVAAAEGGATGELRIDPVFATLSDSMKVPGSSGHTVLGADCIGPEGAGEMIGGSQREDNLERLEEKIRHHNLPLDFFQWYLDTRRYGSVPHSGFGIGMERFVSWVCGGSDTPVHIREVITFPRMLHQFEP